MYATLLEKLESSEYIAAHQAMHGWATDHIPFPGSVLPPDRRVADPRQPTRREPLVTASGELDLGSIACPVMNAVGTADHLVPLESNRPLLDLLPDLDDLEFPAGHVGLIVGRQGAPRLDPRHARLDRRAQRQELTLSDTIEITAFSAADVDDVWAFFQRVPEGDRTLVKEPVTEPGVGGRRGSTTHGRCGRRRGSTATSSGTSP